MSHKETMYRAIDQWVSAKIFRHTRERLYEKARAVIVLKFDKARYALAFHTVLVEVGCLLSSVGYADCLVMPIGFLKLIIIE